MSTGTMKEDMGTVLMKSLIALEECNYDIKTEILSSDDDEEYYTLLLNTLRKKKLELVEFREAIARLGGNHRFIKTVCADMIKTYLDHKLASGILEVTMESIMSDLFNGDSTPGFKASIGSMIKGIGGWIPRSYRKFNRYYTSYKHCG